MIDDFLLDEIKPKKDSLVDRDLESDIFRRLTKAVFVEELERLNLDLEMVSNGRRIKNEHFHRFNIFIKDMNMNRKYSMEDMALFLEEDYFDAKTTVNCLNEENLYVLREEMTVRHKIKRKKTRLSLIIEE